MFFRDNITRGSGLNRVPLPRISWHDSNRPNNRSLRTCRRDSYRRNLLFADGAVMEWAFDTVVDRTRTRLDVLRLRTLSTSGTPHIGPLVPTSRLARQS